MGMKSTDVKKDLQMHYLVGKHMHRMIYIVFYILCTEGKYYVFTFAFICIKTIQEANKMIVGWINGKI